MKAVNVVFGREISDDERKLIGFASEQIISCKVNDNTVCLSLDDDADEEEICSNLKKLVIEKSTSYSPDVFSSNEVARTFCSIESLEQSNIIRRYEDGSVVMNELGVKLYSYFDELCANVVEEYKPVRKKYPTILPISVLNKTNYLATSPQYIHLCSTFNETISEYQQAQELYNGNGLSKIMKRPEHVLSPSACFHLYHDLRNQTLPGSGVYTMRQNVFRNEGRFNWSDLSRLRDYNVREIVFIGDHDYVSEVRTKIMEATTSLFKKLGMTFTIISTSDPFIMPEMQRYKNIQRKQKVKYELQLNNSESHKTACASFNLHGVAFSSKFKFHVEGSEVTESGCVGFGLERIVIAFLNQYGTDQDNWPQLIRDKFK